MKTPTKLFNEVTEFAKNEGYKTTKRYWAGDASHFTRAINKVKPNLKRVGCIVDDWHDGKQRLVIIDVTKYLRGRPKLED
jgi:hypothetical protein